MKKSFFEQMGSTYHQEGDYFLPDLIPPKSVPVGIWGQRRRHYLKTHRQPIYTALFLSDELDSHLSEINQQAEEMFSQLVKQLAEQESITEQLKTERQMEWVGHMNNICKGIPLNPAFVGVRNYLNLNIISWQSVVHNANISMTMI